MMFQKLELVETLEVSGLLQAHLNDTKKDQEVSLSHHAYGELTYMLYTVHESKESRCKKKKVGTLIVNQRIGRIVATAYNGEDQPYECSLENHESGNGCWHAEPIAIAKARGEDLTDRTLFVTDSPCRSCAIAIIRAGIRKVVYQRNHSDPLGRIILRAYGVTLLQL